MTEFMSEEQRFEEGAITHDLPPFTPEEVALRALIEKITQENK